MVSQSKKNSDFEVVLGSHLAPKIKKKPLCFKLFFDMVSAAAFHGPGFPFYVVLASLFDVTLAPSARSANIELDR